MTDNEIDQLKKELEQVKDERDAAKNDMNTIFERKREPNRTYEIDGICDLCSCYDDGYKTPCHGNCENASWRGLQKEEQHV